MAPFSTISLAGAVMTLGGGGLVYGKDNRTLIIGGGVAGIHMGYRLQEQGQPSSIWEMTDKLAGKAAIQHAKDGATFDTGANLLPSGYRDLFILAEELGMKNRDYFKIIPATSLVDPTVACFLGMNFNLTKCQDLTVYTEEVQAKFAFPLSYASWIIGRGILLMQQEDYFTKFMQESTKEGFDWTSPTFSTEQLPRLFVKTVLGDMNTYGQYLDQYTDDAFSNSSNIDNDFNKYALPKKSKAAKEAFSQNMLDFLRERDIFFFRALAEINQNMQGYGNLGDTPLYYSAMWLNPQFLDYIKGRLLRTNNEDTFDGSLYMLKGGLTSMLDAMVAQGDLKVHFNREVTKVVLVKKKTVSFFKVYFKQVKYNRKGERKVSRGMQRFDRVISGMSSQQFVRIYNKGNNIGQPFRCRHASTWVTLDVTVTPTPSLAATLDANGLVFQNDRAYLEDPEVLNMVLVDTFRIKDIPFDKDDGSRRTQLFYSFAFNSSSQCQARDKWSPACPSAVDNEELDDLVNKRFYGNFELEEVHSTVTINNYFPHTKDLSTCDPWKVHKLQGKNMLYFIGGTVNFESVELIMRYNHYLLDTHF